MTVYYSDSRRPAGYRGKHVRRGWWQRGAKPAPQEIGLADLGDETTVTMPMPALAVAG